MNQPTDRLGQPLAVGDWVAKVAGPDPRNNMGKRFQICEIDAADATIKFTKESYGEADVWGHSILFTKINPKQQTTTWDRCVWAPDGIKSPSA